MQNLLMIMKKSQILTIFLKKKKFFIFSFFFFIKEKLSFFGEKVMGDDVDFICSDSLIRKIRTGETNGL